MRNTIILTVLLFIAVVAASIYYFADINFSQKNPAATLKHHPANTLFMAQFTNDDTNNELLGKFDIFEALLGKEESLEIAALKSNLLNAPNFAEYTKDVAIVLSAHTLKERLAFLYAIPLNKEIKATDLKQSLASLNKSYEVDRLDTLGNSFVSLKHTLTKKSLYAITFHSILYASYDLALLAQVLDKKETKLSDAEIRSFVASLSENSPLNLYANNASLAKLAAIYKQGKAGSYLQFLDSLQGQTVVGLNFKEDAYIFSGTSTLTKDSKAYLNLFSQQKPITQSLANYFPENTASYMQIALSDKTSFSSALARYIAGKKETKKLDSYRTNIPDSIDAALKNFFGNEFASIQLNSGESLGFITLKDSLKAESIFSKIASRQQEGIYRFDNSNILYFNYGDLLANFQRPYFTRINNVLIFANQLSELTAFTKRYTNKHLLQQQAAFQNNKELQAEQANVFFYINPSQAKAQIKQDLKNKYAKNFMDTDTYGYQDFNSWSLQLAGAEGNFSSKIIALYKSQKTVGGAATWTYELGSKLINRPWVLKQDASQKLILAQEQDHTVHALKTDGTKLWSAVFEGEILGTPVQLPDYSILLNTSKRLYRILPNGDNYDGFSIALPVRATYGLTYVKSNQGNLLVIPAGNRILAYTEQGTSVASWEDIDLAGSILYQLEAQEINGKMHIMAGTSTGNFYFFNQQGSLIQEINDPGTYQHKLSFKKDASQPQKSSLLTLSEDHGMVQYALNGEKNVLPITWKETPQYYIYGQIAGNKAASLIFFSPTTMWTHKTKDSIVNYQYTFPQKINALPKLVSISSQINWLTVHTEGDLIYAFNEKGSLVEGFPLTGLPHFYIGPLQEGNSTNYLISSKRDHKLYCYPF